MPRPRLEVADVFRAHGPAWRKANAGHVSLAQLKVMSAIETCRTSALGGHVERCEDSLHKAGRLVLLGGLAPLAEDRAFDAALAPLRRAEWVVYAKRPFAGPQAVLAYLARYTHRVAISNSRLIALDDKASPSSGRTIGSKAATASRP